MISEAEKAIHQEISVIAKETLWNFISNGKIDDALAFIATENFSQQAIDAYIDAELPKYLGYKLEWHFGHKAILLFSIKAPATLEVIKKVVATVFDARVFAPQSFNPESGYVPELLDFLFSNYQLSPTNNEVEFQKVFTTTHMEKRMAFILQYGLFPKFKVVGAFLGVDLEKVARELFAKEYQLLTTEDESLLSLSKNLRLAYFNIDLDFSKRSRAFNVLKTVLTKISERENKTQEEAFSENICVPLLVSANTIYEQLSDPTFEIGGRTLKFLEKYFPHHAEDKPSLDDIVNALFSELERVSDHLSSEDILGYTYGIEVEVLRQTSDKMKNSNQDFTRNDWGLTLLMGLNRDKGEINETYEISTKPTVGMVPQLFTYLWLREAGFIDPKVLSDEFENYSLHISTTIESDIWNRTTENVFRNWTMVLGSIFSSKQRLMEKHYLSGGQEVSDKTTESSYEKKSDDSTDLLIERRLFDVTQSNQHLLLKGLPFFDHAYKLWSKLILGKQLNDKEYSVAVMFQKMSEELDRDINQTVNLLPNQDISEVPYTWKLRRYGLVLKYKRYFIELTLAAKKITKAS